jgi:hypothetical protein
MTIPVTYIDNNRDEYLSELCDEVYGSEQEWMAEERIFAPEGSDLEAIMRYSRELFMRS